MQIVQELEANGSLSQEQRDELLLSLLDSIERLNKHIAWHQEQGVPNNPSVTEFSDLRDSYVEQVRLLMTHYGLEVRPLPASPAANRQAA